MPERFIQLLIQRRWIVLVALAVVTSMAAASLPRISFDNSVESWFLESDPSIAVYDKFIETFKADQIGGLIAMVAVAALIADVVFLPVLLRLPLADSVKKSLLVEV